MSEDTKPKKDDTKEKIEKTLDGILGWVQKRKQAAQPTQTVGKASKPWGWVVGLIVAVFVFVALAIMAWRAWKKGREIAKLKHQIDVDKEKKRQAEIDKELTRIEDKRADLEVEASRIQDRIDETKEKIAEAERERQAAHEAIDKVSSWEDVDRILEDD